MYLSDYPLKLLEIKDRESVAEFRKIYLSADTMSIFRIDSGVVVKLNYKHSSVYGYINKTDIIDPFAWSMPDQKLMVAKILYDIVRRKPGGE